MTELLVAALRIGFLALLWLFIAFAANIIRSDIFGKRVPRTQAADTTAADGPTRLHVDQGKGRQQEFELTGDVLSVGRAADSTILIDDDYASTRHAQIHLDQQGRWIVNDLQSTNGTWVNGTRISEPTIITTADVVRIGRTQLRLED